MTPAFRSSVACYSEFRRIPLPEGVLLFTSALAKEGKTFIAIELAMSQAMRLGSKKPTLFIDMNSYNRQGSSILMPPMEEESTPPGLIELLLDEKSMEECIYATDIPRLFLLPYGNFTMDFEPLQHLRSLEYLIRDRLQEYSIIIDTGPIFLRNRRNFDPVEIGAMTDAVLLVVLSGKTPREVILHCKHDLESFGGKIVGIIMNDRFVQPFRSDIARYLDLLEKIPVIKKLIQYLRARMGLF